LFKGEYIVKQNTPEDSHSFKVTQTR